MVGVSVTCNLPTHPRARYAGPFGSVLSASSSSPGGLGDDLARLAHAAVLNGSRDENGDADAILVMGRSVHPDCRPYSCFPP